MAFKTWLLLIFFISGSLALSGCASHPSPDVYGDVLIPLPGVPKDPDNEAVKQAVADILKKAGAPASSVYDYKRYDLNGDRRRDAIVFLKTPYGYWCNVYGCTMMILKAHDSHFTLVNHVQPVREPVYISRNQTAGWHDLVVRVSGREDRAKDVALRHNGRSYPVDPEKLPPTLQLADRRNIRIFYE